jgi:hypothetical protein
MTSAGLLEERMRGQLLVGSRARSPFEVLRSMAAIQAQDYAAAKWALGLRSPGAADGMIESLLSEGRLLRTHVLRPTAERVNARNAP